MIEMLGVLAIIGVLSVGAIAGYQKAMLKYKLNKQAEQLNQVINTVARFSTSFGQFKENEQLFPYLIKMGEIPKEMIKNSNVYLYDIFNNMLYSQVQPTSSTSGTSLKGVTTLFIYPELTKNSMQNLEICKNIYLTIKENSANIYYTYSYVQQDSIPLYGDNYCFENKKCIRDLNVETIYQECTQHIGQTSNHNSINILWKL